VSALIAAELHRMRSRRLFRWLAALATLGFAIGGVSRLMSADPFRLTELHGILKGTSFPLIMLAWVVGASAIGAEWGPRTISALLTWEPRRTRVLLVKLAAAVAYAAAIVVALEVIFTLLMLPAAYSGITSGAGGRWWAEYAATGGRIALVGAVAAMIGFALATIGKNTAAALGGGFAYILVVENLVRGFKPAWADLLLGTNMARVIEGQPGFGLGSHSTAGAAMILLGYAAALFLVAVSIFKGREIG
jgi:ABC-type transport system involved in multi-copper enzyme maturation permease subunit